MTYPLHSLNALIDSTNRLDQVYKASLRAGDVLIVKTCNSVYTVRFHADGSCTVTGGWFDKKGVSPTRVRINGCTWGGSAIKIDIAAACGLSLEFGNRVQTSPIRHIVVFPLRSQN